MTLKFVKNITWIDPEIIAYNMQKTHEFVAFFHSAAKTSYSGSYSYLAFGAEEVCDDFRLLKQKLSDKKSFFDNFWCGYISYENLKNNYPQINLNLKNYIDIPEVIFFKALHLIIFDLKNKTAKFYSKNIVKSLLDNIENKIADTDFIIKNLTASFTKDQYFSKISQIKSSLEKGDYYQLNLTRKIMGEIYNHESFSLYYKLINYSPTPYSAFMQLGSLNILSSSPERFLFIDPEGNINVRPIKGTISNKDNLSHITLKESEKNKSENLMIVDLMRNDLAKISKKNSVITNSLYDLDSFNFLHHLSSSISSQKQGSSYEVVQSIFPPGSMTGAPKKIVMENIAFLEEFSRGIYSGCLGYFAGNGVVDFSVVIRTIIIKDNKFEFQAGGAITYDSVEEEEWLEILTKSVAIYKTLKLDISQIEDL
jgi:para-aminobenzoate synthetase component 1